MQKILYKLFFITTVLTIEIYAQTVSEIAKKAHIANINTLLIFTSQESLNSGQYSLTNIGIDMEVYNLPFKYHFNDVDSRVDYFLVGNVGYSRAYISQDIVIPPNARLNYDNHLRTYTGGLGGGVRYKVTPEIWCMGGVEFIYSRSGASVKKPDNDIGDAIEDFFNQDYNNNISYKAFALMEYRPNIEAFKPYIKLGYKLYETKSTFSFDELTSFNTQSNVSSLTFGSESNKLLKISSYDLTLEGYVNGCYLDGEVANVVEFDSYGSIGGVVYLYTQNTQSWIERFFLEVNTIRADGLEGYNIGVGFTIDY